MKMFKRFIGIRDQVVRHDSLNVTIAIQFSPNLHFSFGKFINLVYLLIWFILKDTIILKDTFILQIKFIILRF